MLTTYVVFVFGGSSILFLSYKWLTEGKRQVDCSCALTFMPGLIRFECTICNESVNGCTKNAANLLWELPAPNKPLTCKAVLGHES